MRISDWSSDVCSSDLQFNAPTLCKLVCDGVKDDADQPIHLGNAKLWILGCQRLDKLGSDHATTPPVAGSTDTQQHYRLTLYTSGKRLRSPKIGRAHVRTPVTNAHLVCRLLLKQHKKQTTGR